MSVRTKKLEREKRQHCKRNRAKWTFACLCSLTLFAVIALWPSGNTSKSSNTVEGRQTPDYLSEMRNDELEAISIDVRNLLCGMDLLKERQITMEDMLQRIDEIIQRVKVETDRNYHRFLADAAHYENSEAYYKALMLVKVLQQDYGMLYNPERVTQAGVIEPNSRFFANSQDVFLHGLLQQKHSGTCASLPVLVITVGRQLGYPLALVSTQNHLFVRWNGQDEKFNIEATSIGMNSYPDDYYRKWPYPVTAQAEKENGYLQPMSASEETAVFFSLRGFCLMAKGQAAESLKAHEQAVKLAPKSLHYQKILENAKVEAKQRMRPAQTNARPLLPPHPMFQDPNLPPEINWAMWEQRENARKQQQEADRIHRNTYLGFPTLNPTGASAPSITPLQQPHQLPNRNNSHHRLRNPF